MPTWMDLINFIDEQLDEKDCNHTLRYTKRFCKAHRLDFKRIRRILSSFKGRCDCLVWRDQDRFKNLHQTIEQDPDLELRPFWSNLFGYLRERMEASPDSSMPAGYFFLCTHSFKYTKKFCEYNGLNTVDILKILNKANAIHCDCEVLTNSRRHFEEDAVIGTEPTINLDEMRNPHFNYADFDPERARQFKDMR